MLTIVNQLTTLASPVTLGVIEANVVVTPSPETLKDLLKEESARVLALGKSAALSAKSILDSRQAYLSLGRDPDRYPVSSEALIKRILQGKALYFINNIVEINNLISLSSGYSVGSYDRNKLGKEVTFRIGKNGETYKGIGKGEFHLENMPVLADEKGPFGSPTSDSEKAMIIPATVSVMMIIYGFGTTYIEEWLNWGAGLLKQFASATEINIIKM